MGKLLIKIFVKDDEEPSNPQVRERFGKFAGIVGIFSNTALCAMKIIIGILSGSIAILADGINNLVDASSSIITLIGFKLAAQPEDENHPYGHARIEYLTGLFVSILIMVVGLQLLKSSFGKVLHPDPLDFNYVTIIVLAVAILIKIWQAAFNTSIGKIIDSVALSATAADSRNDVIATSAVLISVLTGKLFHVQLDGYMGCLVALFIIWSGIQLIRQTSSPLLGEAPDEELVKAIAEKAQAPEGVLGIHDLVVHNYGPGKIFASIHIEVDAAGDLVSSHDMIDNIENSIMRDLKIEFTAHMDPIQLNNPIIEELRRVIVQTITPLQGVHSIHDLRIVSGPTHTNIIFDCVLSSACNMEEPEIKSIIEEQVKKIDPSYFVVIGFDRAYTAL